MIKSNSKLRSSKESIQSSKSGYETPDDNTIGSTDDLLQDPQDVMTMCGDAGWWQLRTFLLAFFAGMPAGLQDFLYIFIAATPDHWCKVTECSAYTYEYLKNLTIPIEYEDGSNRFAKCSQYLTNVSYFYNGTCDSVSVENTTEACREYEFDTSVFHSTIVTEWNLVCGHEFWSSTAQAVYALGSLMGSLVFGIVSDNFGRKRAIILSVLMSIVFGPLVAYAPTYSTFLVARFFLAMGSPGIYDISYILTIEMMAPEWRGVAGNVFGIPYALGYASLAGFAWFWRSWRNLQLFLTAAPCIFLILMFFVPESPRWLIGKGRTDEAEAILRNIAKSNGRTALLPNNFSNIVARLSGKTKEAEDKGCHQKFLKFFTHFFNLFRTPKMRLRTLVLNFCWFSTVLIYFGIALNAPNLSADLFLYTCLSGLLEIPSYLMVPPLLRWIGRRVIFSSMLFICGASLGLSLLFEPGSTPIVALALVGMFHIGGAYALMYLYGIELMPTSVRTYGIGLAAVTGKIGNALAPYIAGLMGKGNKKAPTMVFAGVAVAAALLSLLLPETRNRRLPETIDDVENS